MSSTEEALHAEAKAKADKRKTSPKGHGQNMKTQHDTNKKEKRTGRIAARGAGTWGEGGVPDFQTWGGRVRKGALVDQDMF